MAAQAGPVVAMVFVFTSTKAVLGFSSIKVAAAHWVVDVGSTMFHPQATKANKSRVIAA